MADRLRVALLIESSRAYGRGLLQGIAAYARAHGPWSIYQHERALGDDAPPWMKGWQGDGVIARVESRKLSRRLQRLRLPTVDLRGLHDMPAVPLIETNDRLVVRMALDHLIDRGFEHLAFCGYHGANYSDRRLQYFREMLAGHSHEPLVYENPVVSRRKLPVGDTATIEAGGLLYEDKIAAWLTSLPRPVGIVACNDTRGRQVLSACREHAIAVPDEVAVIGVDNDQVLCELSDPALTSVEPDTYRIGYEAAAMLEAMIRTKKKPPAKTFIDPLGVVTRRSTDALAIADRDVAAAVRFIREHACEGIGVEDVLDHVTLSRSTLERRFAAFLGRPPKAEILRVQIERIKHLLADTAYPLARVAEIAGFKHVEHMCTLFRNKTGQTPSTYRAAAAKAPTRRPALPQAR
jgi:LacI family transcriptional regulator